MNTYERQALKVLDAVKESERGFNRLLCTCGHPFWIHVLREGQGPYEAGGGCISMLPSDDSTVNAHGYCVCPAFVPSDRPAFEAVLDALSDEITRLHRIEEREEPR